ncbi:LOW QUALITY PROTEIN: Rad21/Rec8-like protein, N-terminal [Dillenia turbinata]|uniref:Rad21/Rec8-like protein, N-terminal n=1 Tax=Dillenia turbinata TaxID=194707 RepID=A0AAN8VEW0_9MAGN
MAAVNHFSYCIGFTKINLQALLPKSDNTMPLHHRDYRRGQTMFNCGYEIEMCEISYLDILGFSMYDRIMEPEVPIALRMQGFLLLGVTRIFAKKVDYLHQDCNVVLITLRKATVAIEVTLPEDASQAPFHSVTLPETFELDALDLDNDSYDGCTDTYFEFQGPRYTSQESAGHHTYRSDGHYSLELNEFLMYTEQIPCGRDPYIAVSLTEVDISFGSRTFMDQVMGSAPQQKVKEFGPEPMDEDVPGGNGGDFSDPGPSEHILRFSDAGPSIQDERFNERFPEDSVIDNLAEMEIMRDTDNLTEMEIMRDAIPELQSYDHLLHHHNVSDAGESRGSKDQLRNVKEIPSPILEDVIVSGGQSVPFELHPEPPASAASKDPTNVDSHISFRHASPHLALRPSPPSEKPKPRQKKRKQFFDESTVLTNRYGIMKKALEDSSDLVQKRKKLPCSNIDLWKFNNHFRKDQIFLAPLISGLCVDLCDVSKKDFILEKPHLAVVEEDNVQPSPAQTPAAMQNEDMEIGRLRQDEGPASSVFPESLLPSGRELTPDIEPSTEPLFGMTSQSQLLPTSDLETSTGLFGSEVQTPMIFTEERLGIDNTGLSDIPEYTFEAQMWHLWQDDLGFLEVDNNSPVGSQGTQEVDALSARTRAVAQYLKRQSPIAELSDDVPRDLSLNKILEGKKRKLCSRMFFETLVRMIFSFSHVLKSYGLIDVEQGEPYGDSTPGDATENEIPLANNSSFDWRILRS